MEKTKRILSIFLVVLMLFTSLPMNVFAEEITTFAEENTTAEMTTDAGDISVTEETTEEVITEEPIYEDGGRYTVNGVKYRIYNEEAYVIGYESDIPEDIIIMDSLGDYKVVSIKGFILDNKDRVKSVYIPESVREICDNAFADCTALESAVLLCDYVKLGAGVFDNTPFLEKESVQEKDLLILDGKWLIKWTFSGEKYVHLDENITAVAADAFLNNMSHNIDTICVSNPDCCFGFTKNPWSVSALIVAHRGSTAIKLAITYKMDFSYLCSHTDTLVYEPESHPVCNGTSGYTEGYWCEECQRWAIGHKKKAQFLHLDENGDGICDICTADASVPVKKGGIRGEHTWVILEDGTLIFSGEGKMLGYESEYEMIQDKEIWYINNALRNSIKKIIVREGITSVGANIFKSMVNLQEVVLPEGITTIEKKAFYGSRMTKINFPSTLKKIEGSAFSSCVGITELELPEGITSIGACAFSYIRDEYIVVPESVENIGLGAFSNCLCLKEIVFQRPLKVLPEALFSGCKVLEKVDFNCDVEVINARAFKDCVSFSGLELTGSLKTIGDEAFSGCSAIESINIPESVTFIGAEAFKDCTGLKEITIPASIVKISASTFSGCKNLSKATMLGNVTQIGDFAFSNTALREVILPENLKTLGEGAYSDCKELEAFTFNSKITSLGKNCLAGAGINEIKLPGSVSTYKDLFDASENIHTVILPDNLTSIAAEYFSGNKYVKHIIVPDSVITVGNKAFYRNSALEDISFKAVTSIGEQAFFECTALESIGMGEALAKILTSAFEGCRSLMTVTLPDTILEIGERAFALCNNLSDIYINSVGCNTIGIDAIMYKVTIYGYANTAVERYAGENGNAFIAFEEENPHIHSFEKTIDGGMCKKNIRYKYVCEECGIFYYENLNYSYHIFKDAYSVTKEPTCLEDGKRVKYCICAQAKRDEQTIPATGHEMVIDNVAVAPTETTEGWTQGSHCGICGIALETKIIVSPDEFDITVTADGVMARKSVPATYASNGMITDISFVGQDSSIKTEISRTVIYKIGKISLSSTAYVCDGKIYKPTLTVTDSRGKVIPTSAYSVSYSDSRSKMPGRYSVTISFSGNYYGKKNYYYTINPADVKNIRASAKATAVKLQWDKVVGADGYMIYDSNKRLVATVENNFYENTSIKAATRHKLYIRAFSWKDSSIFYSQSYKEHTFTTLPENVKNLKVPSRTTSSLTLSWNGVSGADSYKIYRYDSSKKKYIFLSGTKSKSYKVKGLSAGKTYTYCVKACFKDGDKEYLSKSYAKITAATSLKKPVVTLKSASKSVTVSVKKVSNATGYEIYMAESKNGKYKKIKTVKTTKNCTYKKKNLKKGKTCYFKVRAYKTVGKQKVYSSYSAVKKVKVR